MHVVNPQPKRGPMDPGAREAFLAGSPLATLRRLVLREPRSTRLGRLVFIRHGESVANERNVFAGTDDVPLTTFGRAQAREAGERLVALGMAFDEVHTSRLGRAKETARIVAATAQQCLRAPVRWTTGVAALDERDFGTFTGRNKNLAARAVGFFRFESMLHAPDDAPPGGESTRVFFARVKRYYDEVLLPKRRAGLDVLVVAHKYVVEMMALVAAGRGPEANFDMKLPNSRPVEFEELPGFVRAERRSVQKAGDFLTAHCAEFAVGAAALGAVAQAFLGAKLPGDLYIGVMLALLAGAALLNALDVDIRQTARDYGGRQVAAFAAQWLPRVGLGAALLAAGSGVVSLAGVLLLTPPATATPVLARLWGGEGRRAGLETALFSLLLPLAVAAAALVGMLPMGIAAGALLAAMLGIALATVAGQAVRARAKTATAAFCLRWGWLAPLALVSMALLGAYQLAPSVWAYGTVEGMAWFAATFVTLRVALGAMSGLVNRAAPETERCDARIVQQNPNVLVWATVGAEVGAAGFACLVCMLACLAADGWLRVVRERSAMRAGSLRAPTAQRAAGPWPAPDSASGSPGKTSR